MITVECSFIIHYLDVTKNFWQNTNQFSWVIQFYISNHPSLPNKFSFLGDDCWYSLRPRQVIKAIGAAGRSMLDTWRKEGGGREKWDDFDRKWDSNSQEDSEKMLVVEF
jgi:hypothetical protein